MTKPGFRGAHLRWPFDRDKRPFSVRLVEPTAYHPSSHAAIFNAALTAMLEPVRRPLDIYDAGAPTFNSRRFDLITFPEAFITPGTLCDTLQAFKNFGASGCVHTGLRASVDENGPHLFSTSEMQALVDDLTSILPTTKVDLRPFTLWLMNQDPRDYFNLGCLFLNDADGHTRVCLHPKLVRSKFEISSSRRQTMAEANLLTLITLMPRRKELGTITLQPLICSDVLPLETDSGRDPPMKAVNRFADCLGKAPPDHIDIVSVVTCTPQSVRQRNGSSKPRIWHDLFRTAFLEAARDPACARHHFAAIVLANFREYRSSAAGLSGVFLPVAPTPLSFRPETTVSLWGRPSKRYKNNRWSEAGEAISAKWSPLGFIAALDPSYSGAGRIFGFTIHRLLREVSPWEQATRLTSIEIWDGVNDAAGKVKFIERVEP
ncbi:hypothetical protein LB577_27380 [Mesorhizobium sp. B283B1A]|uniref:hypothetical protein n=1 Tax=Mesorhizobium TaxID=68287 RepID=UPI001CD187B2|nr:MULTISPECIES: hypothetical protein [Mesorhizobium]MCA0050630.1 hypothetical protein [Mesorhizobium sp. B283B1A]UQS66938.1 hypothetical protein M5D98_11675 [Mesorhizobium opportunistum]